MFHRSRPPFQVSPEPPVRTTDADLNEARQARVESTREFLDAVDQNLEVRQRAGRLRDRRNLNHFTELLEKSVYPWR